MWKASGASLPTVLIVENGNGSVYIVENKETESQVDKILKTEKKQSTRKPATKLNTREPSPEVIR